MEWTCSKLGCAKIDMLKNNMELYSYVIPRDYGFAPNPFGGICSLATCKPQIRKHASIGDWISGFGGANTSITRKMVFLMQVDDICTFDEYWDNPNFSYKKPIFEGKYQDCYGDNIYHHTKDGHWIQEDSHHSYENGVVNMNNLMHDTGTDRVLLSENFWYFGDSAIDLPLELSRVIAYGRGYRKFDQEICTEIVRWVAEQYEPGQHGLPYSWTRRRGFIRYKGERT